MAEKETVSIRFGGKLSDRINYEQWQELCSLQRYFKMPSTGKLAEAALHYAYAMRNKINMQSSKKPDTEPLPHIPCEKYAMLEETLQNGLVTKDIEIECGELSVLIKKGARARLFQPYIISFEPSYDTRFSIDLSLEWKIIDDAKKIVLTGK